MQSRGARCLDSSSQGGKNPAGRARHAAPPLDSAAGFQHNAGYAKAPRKGCPPGRIFGGGEKRRPR